MRSHILNGVAFMCLAILLMQFFAAWTCFTGPSRYLSGVVTSSAMPNVSVAAFEKLAGPAAWTSAPRSHRRPCVWLPYDCGKQVSAKSATRGSNLRGPGPCCDGRMRSRSRLLRGGALPAVGNVAIDERGVAVLRSQVLGNVSVRFQARVRRFSRRYCYARVTHTVLGSKPHSLTHSPAQRWASRAAMTLATSLSLKRR